MGVRENLEDDREEKAVYEMVYSCITWGVWCGRDGGGGGG